MAEESIVKCDGCGAHGKKRIGDAAPDFWFYMLTENVTPRRDGRKTDIYVVWACSEACRDGLWKRGPGPGVIDERDERKRNELAKEVTARPRVTLTVRCGRPSGGDMRPDCDWSGDASELRDEDGCTYCPKCGYATSVDGDAIR